MTSINLNDLLRAKIGNAITSVPCSIDLDEVLEFNDLHECDIDIHKLLTRDRQIAIIWSTEDVKAVRPDLNEDQAWQVLQECERHHDCELGFNWVLIETTADDLFPAREDGGDE